MAAPTNTTTTLVSIGNREDLEDKIYRVAPEETPYLSNIGKSSATGILHEWQTEALAAPSATNAALEGGDVGTLDAPNLTTRVSNYCQIVTKSYGVARSQEVVNKAGRKSELNRQKVLKGIEARRDQEMRAVGNFASNAESGGTARKFGGAMAWLTSNVSRGASGASGGYGSGVVAAATNGTQRAFTESLLKTVLGTAYSAGARISQAYMGPTHKQQASAFTGIASIRKDAGSGQATIVAAADVYVSDFGEIAFIPHPYGITRDCLLIDPDMWSLAVLDGWKSTPLAVNGDSERYLLTNESTLVCKNEKGNGIVADLT